jgi:hypothetical protein
MFVESIESLNHIHPVVLMFYGASLQSKLAKALFHCITKQFIVIIF